VLVVIQFALATTLMIGAGVLLQNFSHLQNVNLGFRSDHLLTASLHLPQVDESASIEANWAIYRQLLEDARALPGVVSVGLTNGIPMGPLNTSMEIGPITPTSSPSDKGIQTSWRIATSDYLTTLDIPLRGGRLFDANREPRNSILLSEGLAKRLWPNGEDAVGHRVWLGNGQLFNVIGVVGDVRQLGVAQDLTPTVYLPTSWYLWPTMTLVLRTSADPLGVIGPLREMARGISPDQPLFDIRPMSSVIAADVAQPRLQTSLLIAFAAISLLLAAFGVAGVIAYLVARRTPELALRMALGASTQSVLRHVLGQGGMLCALGVGVGVVLAFAIGRLFASSIGSEGVNLPLTLILTTGPLFAAGLLACWLPALRATRISPSAALRAE
jgi:putative ABC transport system permease protein